VQGAGKKRGLRKKDKIRGQGSGVRVQLKKRQGIRVKDKYCREEQRIYKEIKSYKDLIVYQKAYELALKTYKATDSFPKVEQYGLVQQMRRASVSIPSNIAEGYRRKNRKEYIQFLNIAYGSAGELETQVSLAHDLEMLQKDDFISLQSLCEEVSKLLFNLIKSLKQ
jgi:four helix bundle protein